MNEAPFGLWKTRQQPRSLSQPNAAWGPQHLRQPRSRLLLVVVPLLFAACRSEMVRSAQGDGALWRTVELHLRLDSAATELRCEHGTGAPAHPLLLPGASIEMQHRVRCVDQPNGDSARPGFLRTFSENSFEFVLRAADGDERTRCILAGPTGENGVFFLDRPDAESHRPAWEVQDTEQNHVADLLGAWLTEAASDGEAANRFLTWLNAGGILFPGYDRDFDSDAWQRLHIVLVPELPPWPESWKQGLRGSIAGEPDGGRATHLIRLDMGGETPLAPVIKRALATMGTEGVSSSGRVQEVDRNSVLEKAPGKTVDMPDSYVDMLNYTGSIHWTLLGSGEVVSGGTRGRVERVELRCQLTIEYELEWAYMWDTPQVEELSGRRQELWTGELVVLGGRSERRADGVVAP